MHLVLSGPAGGVIGAAGARQASLGHENLITIDMGGTSLDASLIAGGQAKVETEQPVREAARINIPTIDIHTIGAGGGSIAWVDEGGAPAGRARRAQAPSPGRSATAKGGEQGDVHRRRAGGRLPRIRRTSSAERLPLDPGPRRRRRSPSSPTDLGISVRRRLAAGILRITNAKIAGRCA